MTPSNLDDAQQGQEESSGISKLHRNRIRVDCDPSKELEVELGGEYPWRFKLVGGQAAQRKRLKTRASKQPAGEHLNNDALIMGAL